MLDLGLEGKGVSNQNLLFGIQTFLFMLLGVEAAGASALATAVPVVLEAFAVELQAPRVRAVTWLESWVVGCLEIVRFVRHVALVRSLGMMGAGFKVLPVACLPIRVLKRCNLSILRYYSLVFIVVHVGGLQ